MKRLMILAACIALCGCAGPRLGFATYEARNAELMWQAMHALDTAQTVSIAKSPACLYEKAPLAQMVYGTKHPSVERVLITNTAGAALHWTAGAWLDRATERSFAREGDNRGMLYAARIAYYGLSFMGTGTAVIGNVQLGIKPGKRKYCAEDPRP